MSNFKSLNICIFDNRMLNFFDKNNFKERDLIERGNADDELKAESENVKYVCFD